MTMMPKGKRWAVLARDDFTCRYCGAHGAGVVLHVDHVTPRAAGGLNDIGNLVTSCADCNHGKSDNILPTKTVKAIAKESERRAMEQRSADEWIAAYDETHALALANYDDFYRYMRDDDIESHGADDAGWATL